MHIPVGYMLIFFVTLVHASSGYTEANMRVHMHFDNIRKGAGCRPPVTFEMARAVRTQAVAPLFFSRTVAVGTPHNHPSLSGGGPPPVAPSFRSSSARLR